MKKIILSMGAFMLNSGQALRQQKIKPGTEHLHTHGGTGTRVRYTAVLYQKNTCLQSDV